MKKKTFIYLAIPVILLVMGVWFLQGLQPVDSSSTTRVKVKIEAGASTDQILNQLKEERLIRSPLAAKLYLKLNGLEGSLQAGVFLLQKSYSLQEIVEMLQTGKAAEIALTVPEGFTVKDIDRLVAGAGLAEEGAVIDCANTCDFSTFEFVPQQVGGLAERGGKLEGYLFPDTYYVPVDDFVAKFFLERMLGNFRKQILTPYEGLIASDPHSLHDIVTMASLVEKESRKDDERSTVAGILWKRLDAGWGLGVDAAVRYIANKPVEDITVADLNINSPYNLRKFTGLTPGPIANAGKKSFEAVLYPKDTRYWYYLHDKTGQIHYSETNEEHNVKRYRYLGSGSASGE